MRKEIIEKYQPSFGFYGVCSCVCVCVYVCVRVFLWVRTQKPLWKYTHLNINTHTSYIYIYIYIYIYTHTRGKTFLVINLYIYIYIYICINTSGWVKSFFRISSISVSVHKAEFREVSIDGALWRTKSCRQCTSVSAWLLFNNFNQGLTFHNKMSLWPWFIFEAGVTFIEMSESVFCLTFVDSSLGLIHHSFLLPLLLPLNPILFPQVARNCTLRFFPPHPLSKALNMIKNKQFL